MYPGGKAAALHKPALFCNQVAAAVFCKQLMTLPEWHFPRHGTCRHDTNVFFFFVEVDTESPLHPFLLTFCAKAGQMEFSKLCKSKVGAMVEDQPLDSNDSTSHVWVCVNMSWIDPFMARGNRHHTGTTSGTIVPYAKSLDS